MNYIKLSVLIILISLVGCSLNKKNVNSNIVTSENTVKVEFNRPDGIASIEFDENGNFVSITAKATAPFTEQNTQAVEQAITVATLKAKRNISEFIESDLTSERTINIIGDSALKRVKNKTVKSLTVSDLDYVEDGSSTANNSSDQDDLNSQKVTENVTEYIRLSSENIIRGLQVVRESVDNKQNTVLVEVQVTKNQIKAAKNMKEMIN